MKKRFSNYQLPTNFQNLIHEKSFKNVVREFVLEGNYYSGLQFNK